MFRIVGGIGNAWPNLGAALDQGEDEFDVVIAQQVARHQEATGTASDDNAPLAGVGAICAPEKGQSRFNRVFS